MNKQQSRIALPLQLVMNPNPLVGLCIVVREIRRGTLVGYFQLLIAPDHMGGNLALSDMRARKGSEAPRHIHTREDEHFQVVEGQIRFQIGDQTILAGPGQTVLAPRNMPHQFTILSEQAQLLNGFTPGHFVQYILAWSQPLPQEPTSLPLPSGPPLANVLARRIEQLAQQYGVYFTRPGDR